MSEKYKQKKIILPTYPIFKFSITGNRDTILVGLRHTIKKINE